MSESENSTNIQITTDNEEKKDNCIPKCCCKISKTIIFILLICLIVSLFYSIKTNFAINKYKKAISFKNSKDYETAKDLFVQLGDFIDSKNQLEECNQIINKYSEAVVLMKYKEFQKAMTLLGQINDFKDSKELLKVCYSNTKEGMYTEALNSKKSGNYSEAVRIFEQLGDYKDCKEQLNFCSEIISINEAKIGDIVKFGIYEQDADEINGKEPIEWIVLDKEDNKTFLFSKHGLDSIDYDNKSEEQEINWDKCSLRKWLNNDFLNIAFNQYEKEIISVTSVIQDVTRDVSPERISTLIPLYNKVNQGPNTSDKIFLLGINEIYYYFPKSDSLYDAKICEPTEFVKSKKDFLDVSNEHKYWRLRTLADNSHNAVIEGNKSSNPYYFISDNGECKCLIRPALWVNLGGSI